MEKYPILESVMIAAYTTPKTSTSDNSTKIVRNWSAAIAGLIANDSNMDPFEYLFTKENFMILEHESIMTV